MKVTWNSGFINPPKSGEYYIAIEALVDIPHNGIKQGDVQIGVDYYEASEEMWDTIGEDNPYWTVICWADIPHPDIPDSLRDRVTSYFGHKVSEE